MSQSLWHLLPKSDKNYELKMWPLPDTETIKIHRVAHLLYELPLKIEKNGVSVKIKADTINRTKKFKMIMKRESLCFETFPSNDNIFIHIDNDDYFKSVRFDTNQRHVIVPLTPQNTTIPLNGKI